MDLAEEKGKNLERPPAFYLEMVSTYKKGTGSRMHLGWLEDRGWREWVWFMCSTWLRHPSGDPMYVLIRID